jgi:hypothetical protein
MVRTMLHEVKDVYLGIHGVAVRNVHSRAVQGDFRIVM